MYGSRRRNHRHHLTPRSSLTIGQCIANRSINDHDVFLHNASSLNVDILL